MNVLGIALVWCVVQVTLVGLLAAGLYLAARALRPGAAIPIVLSGLATIVGLSLLTLSPWPCWRVLQEPPLPAVTETVAADEDFAPAERLEQADATAPLPASSKPRPLESASPPPAPRTNILSQLIAPPAGAGWHWPAVVALTLLIGSGCGLIWLLVGLTAVNTHRSESRPVRDRELAELVDVLCAELGCAQKIEVRQSKRLVTAAMIGWRRPTLLLPTDWQTWTAAERRAVLAHEIAHARNHDCLTALCGQLALMLHVYHPLLHWLAGRLRLEQELAADAAAASISGGQQQYLTTIAALALRQHDRRLSWPARSFLPTRTTFLRRIAMLRDNKLRVDRLSLLPRLLSVGVVLLGGLAAAGLRGPASPTPAVAAPPARSAKDATKGQERLNYVGDTSSDKRSLGGSGHAITFRRSAQAKYLVAVEMFASRYGTPQPPQEDFHVYVLDKERKVLQDFLFPYALIARGQEVWYRLNVPAMEVPEEFSIALNFNPHQTKGIYLGFDRNVETSHSYMGLPGQGFRAVPEKYDWMIRAYLVADAKKFKVRGGPNMGRPAGAAAKPAQAANPAAAIKEAVEQVSQMSEMDPRLSGILEGLKSLNQEQAVAALVKCLDAKVDNERRAAIFLLWKGGFTAITPAVPRLLQLCEHEEDTTRGMAAIALGSHHVKGSFKTLEKMTASDPSGYARRCAAYALGLLGNAEATATLKKALKDPESLVRNNAQLALTMLDKSSIYTQRSTNDIQPDGSIRFQGGFTVRNASAQPLHVYRFVNSDFVKLEKLTDPAGKNVPFEVQHEGEHFRYRVPLDPPVAPGASLELSTEGTETTLIKPGDEPGTFVYTMKHWPATSCDTRRIEVHRLPAGAELVSKSPAELVESKKDGRIELRIERIIPPGGSLEISYCYRLPQKGAAIKSSASAGDAAQLARQGWQLWNSGQADLAVEKFRQAVKLAPNDQVALNGLGWAHFNSGNPAEAQQAFERVVALNPTHPGALNGLGQVLLAQRNYPQAEAHLLKAAPQAPAAWWGLAKLYLLQGKFDEARKWAQKIVDAGDATDDARQLLQAAKTKQLSDSLRATIEPPAPQ